jgi:hypothetical protein
MAVGLMVRVAEGEAAELATDMRLSKIAFYYRIALYKIEQFVALRWYRRLMKQHIRKTLQGLEGKELEHMKEICGFKESRLYGHTIELRESGVRLVYWNAWLEIEDEVYKMRLLRKGIEDPGTSLFFLERGK